MTSANRRIRNSRCSSPARLRGWGEEGEEAGVEGEEAGEEGEETMKEGEGGG